MLADLAMEGRGAGAELVHVAEDGDARPLAGDLAEVVDRGLHRDGIGVVGVVQQQAAAGQLVEMTAQTRRTRPQRAPVLASSSV